MPPQSKDPSIITPNKPTQFSPSSTPTPPSSPEPSLGGTPQDISFPSETQKPKKGKKKLLIAILVILLLAIIGGLVYWFVLREEPKAEEPKSENVISTAAPGTVFCKKLGLESLHCENLDTKELRKYKLPTSLGDISTLSASPDGSKYFISTWKEDEKGTQTETAGVYNAKLELISELPYKVDESGSTGIPIYNIVWIDNNRLAYEKSAGTTENKTSTIQSFDASTKKESELVKVDADIEHIFAVPGKEYLYGVQAKVDTAQNSVVRNLAKIDIKAKSVKPVQADNVGFEDISYDSSKTLFYKNNILDDQKTEVKVYKVENPDTEPKLVETQTIKDGYAAGSYAYEAVNTIKGVYITTGMLTENGPVKFYDASGTITNSSIGVGYSGSSILLSLADFPNFPKADKNEPVVSDFFVPTADTPKKITAFLEKRVTENPKCNKGTFATFELMNNDGDKQFSVLESSCDITGMAVYIADGDSYKSVLTTQEGVSCETRDKLGITAKTVPECRKPGEGL